MESIPPVSPSLKTCTKCNQSLPLSQFNKQAVSHDGHAWQCKSCNRSSCRAAHAADKNRRNANSRDYHAAHRDELNQKNRRYNAANKQVLKDKRKQRLAEMPDHVKQVRKQWYLSHQSQLLAVKRKYYLDNKEWINQKGSLWARANRDKCRSYYHAREARKLNNGGSFTPSEWHELKSAFGNVCLRCGRKESEVEITVDHIKPLTLGGSSFIYNLQPLCRSCNASKGDKEIDYRPA